jgi:hypothetical protein
MSIPFVRLGLYCPRDVPKGASLGMYVSRQHYPVRQMTVNSDEATSCRDLGFPVTFTIQLPPDAQALVDDSHRQDARTASHQTKL